jgi:endonuclease/exonuclease/phosphatase (EEP) superfamily protein YafD
MRDTSTVLNDCLHRNEVTHPGTHGFSDATFDFIFVKGLTGTQPAITQTNASDHWPVTRIFRLR